MRKLAILTILAVLSVAALATDAATASATPRKAVFTAPLTWRADGLGQFKFDGSVHLENAEITKDGSIQTGPEEGTCELASPCMTDGVIYRVSASWTFTGAVTMQISATGKSEDYKSVTNGVPADYGDFTPGSQLKWRVTLGPQSTLTDVKIVYSDLSGVMGSFGNPDLSGFVARKELFIKGSPDGPLYNFQIPVKVGESGKAAGCDVYLEVPSKSDLADIRFTQKDGETPLPYYLESLAGSKPDRSGLFWVKIPEIPKTGLPIYIYYGCSGAKDLSVGSKVFDFFDDFNTTGIDSKVWRIVYEDKTSQANISGSLLFIDKARITSGTYNLTNGIIEYRAKLSGNGGIEGIIAAGQAADKDLAAYSSIVAASANCIMQGAKVIANDPRQIELDTFYDFRVTATNNNVVFQRYCEGWAGSPQAETKCSLEGNKPASPIGLSAGPGAGGLYCDWIRTRKTANIPPQIDINRTGKEEPATLPAFSDLSLAPDGSIILDKDASSGEYTSTFIRMPFEARILAASWTENESDSGPVKISISTKEDGDFANGWQNGVSKYASKKEFEKTSLLRWKAKLSRKVSSSPSPSLKQFSLAFQPGTIKILLPAGGESVMSGSRYNIFWDAAGYEPSYVMNLYYSNDGGENFQPIAMKLANSGSYTWATPDEETSKAVVMVVDSYDSRVSGISGIFTISKNAGGVVVQAPVETAAVEDKGAVTKTAEEKTVEEKPTAAAEGGAKLYELLIMRTANTKKAATSIFKDGDIVMIQPAGFSWGPEEVKNFTIVQAYLTDSEVRELMKSRDRMPRRYKIDMTKKEMLSRGALEKRGYLSGAPLNQKDKASVMVDKAVARQEGE